METAILSLNIVIGNHFIFFLNQVGEVLSILIAEKFNSGVGLVEGFSCINGYEHEFFFSLFVCLLGVSCADQADLLYTGG